MGYPVTYRTEQARAAKRAASPSFQGANDNRPGTVRRLPSSSGKPRFNFLRMGQVRPPSNPFGLRQRQANQRALLGAIKGGLKFRQRLMSSVARYVLRHLMNYALERVFWHPRPVQVGWTVSGLWGISGNHGGTAAHTNGQTVSHNPGPLTFGHPWTGPPFDWAEYDTVTRVVNPITNAVSHSFVQVGRGDMGTGPDPRTMNNNKQLWPGMQAPSINPWAPGYNPSWNRHPGRWPNNMPKLRPRPMPMLEPGDMPINGPQPLPMPMPWALIPHVQPNPYRDPHEQSRRGPVRIRRPELEPFPPPTLPDIIFTPNPPSPKPPPKDKPGPLYPPRDRIIFEQGKPKVTRRGDGKRDDKPGPKVKERKSKASSKLARLFLTAINGITEMNDLILALWKGLPKKYQKGNIIRDKWRDVYEHIEDIDIGLATKAAIRNQIEDWLYGRLGSTSGKAAFRQGKFFDGLSRNARKFSDDLYDPLSKQNLDNYMGPNSGYVQWATDRIMWREYAKATRSQREFANDPVEYILDRIFGENS